MGGCSTLNETCREYSQHLAYVEDPSTTAEFITSIPCPENIVDSWKECCLKNELISTEQKCKEDSHTSKIPTMNRYAMSSP
jgi:hypothetical protein